jgi:fatty-acyl-CoA synthase
MQRRIEQVAFELKEGGLNFGDRVAYIGFNHPLMLVTLFAAARIGAVFVPLNYRLSLAELIAIVEDANAHTLIADEQHALRIDGARHHLPCKRYLILGATTVSWEAVPLFATEELAAPLPTPAASGDLVLLLYTSGTTGKPKGVTVSNGNIWTSIIDAILTHNFKSSDVTLNAAPLFHAAGLCTMSLPTLMAGGHLILQRGFDVPNYLLALEKYHVTVSLMVPAMMLSMSRHESFATVDLSAMRLLVTGAGPVPEPLLDTYNARRIPVSQGYGMTESTSAVTILDSGHAVRKLGSCGRPTLLIDMRLIDSESRVITQPYVRGEVCLRGSSITRGYWNRPLETAAAFDSEGWFHSGDGAYFDEDGFYYICDRIKDMIISGGENIYPAEIENVLYEHPAISELAVIGSPDARWGERVIVVAVLKSGASLSLEELVRFAEPRLARYKLPQELHLVEVLPRTSTGKLIKTELRQRFVKGTAHSSSDDGVRQIACSK